MFLLSFIDQHRGFEWNKGVARDSLTKYRLIDKDCTATGIKTL